MNFVIAGGSHGIGLEIVKLLSDTAERIDVCSRTPGELPLSGPVVYHECDFSSEQAELDHLPETIDGAVYCPGSINLRSFRSLKVSDFRSDLEINLIGAIKFLQSCLPGLKKRWW